MKFLLSFTVALLLSFSAEAANPDYKAFRGAGTVSVVTNPPNGTIVTTGSSNLTAIAANDSTFGKVVSTNGVFSGAQGTQGTLWSFDLSLGQYREFLSMSPSGFIVGTSGFPMVVRSSALNVLGAITGAVVSVTDDAYAIGWNGSLEVPTKNAVYDKIETITSGAGGTNFPNLNLMVGATNYVLTSGIRKAFLQSTGANNYVNLNLAVPNSGYHVLIGHTNSAATNFDVQFFTNSVAASFYSIRDKTNSTSWTVPAGSISWREFTFTGSAWLCTAVQDPLYTLLWGNGFATPSTNGLNVTQQLKDVLTNLLGTVAKNVTNENSAALQIDNGTLTLTPGVVSNLVANTIDFPGTGNIISNVTQIKFKSPTSPAITVSNLVLNFNTNRYFLSGLTNIIFTNIVEESASIQDTSDMTVFVKNTTAVTMGLVWPAYGAQHGYFIRTNANNPAITTTTLASGAIGVASITAAPDGTNLFLTFTVWP